MRKSIVLFGACAAVFFSTAVAQSGNKKPAEAENKNSVAQTDPQQPPAAPQPKTQPPADQQTPAQNPPQQTPPATPPATSPSEQQNASPAGQRPPAMTAASQQAAATAATSVADTRTYVIGAEDVLRVLVWREPELSGSFNVRPDGKISLPLVNEVQAAGLTPEKLGAVISQGLTKYMTHPEVSVAVQQVNSKKYFIIGEVQKTGSFPLVVPTTVLEALVNAGGFRDFANSKKIAILRGTQRFTFNYKDVIRGKHREQNILLENGDQIVVP